MPATCHVRPELAVRGCDTARPDTVADATYNPPRDHAIGVGHHVLPDGTISLFVSIHVGADVLMARLDQPGVEWLMREVVSNLNMMIRATADQRPPPPGTVLN
jgi:hypothetical protein